MKLDESSSKPLFQQIAEIIEDMIIEDDLKDEDQVFSTNQLSETFKINPATARKGLNLLVEKGVLFKKRGLGMFVEKGAKEIIKSERKNHFYDNYILIMLKEAKKLSISEEEVINMIKLQREGE